MDSLARDASASGAAIASSMGARIPGYAGLRRRDSLDMSVGVSSAGQVPSKVRLAFAECRESLSELFARIDSNGNGQLDKKELVDELLDMELGLSVAECEGIFSVIAKGGEFITLEGWMEFVESARRGDDEQTKPASGSRIPGFAGLRRRDSMDNAVGTSSFGKVSKEGCSCQCWRWRWRRPSARRVSLPFPSANLQMLSS